MISECLNISTYIPAGGLVGRFSAASFTERRRGRLRLEG